MAIDIKDAARLNDIVKAAAGDKSFGNGFDNFSGGVQSPLLGRYSAGSRFLRQLTYTTWALAAVQLRRITTEPCATASGKAGIRSMSIRSLTLAALMLAYRLVCRDANPAVRAVTAAWLRAWTIS